MWPLSVDWQTLRFGVEIEFVGGDPKAVALLPGWRMAFDETQNDDTGRESGAELTPPPLRWSEREQVREMLGRLRQTGARANWGCGLHVHVGLEPWGPAIVPPLLDAALASQSALKTLLRTTEHRLIYCPPVSPEMKAEYGVNPGRSALTRRGRPQSHRCGINARSWYDHGTVEIRYANGSVDFDEVARTVELCLRFVAAVGAGHALPCEADELAAALGMPACGYPPPTPAPIWHWERMWLEDALIPVLRTVLEQQLPDAEIHHIRPNREGFLVTVEQPGGIPSRFQVCPEPGGWRITRSETYVGPCSSGSVPDQTP